VRFEFLTTVDVSILFFWVVTPCRLIGRYRRFFGSEYGDKTLVLPTRLHGVRTQNIAKHTKSQPPDYAYVLCARILST
jgi:hypothetical protein